jgi:Ni,Fe-hydrogenase I large subunit
MSVAGEVLVQLNVIGTEISDVSVRSERPLHLPQMMSGRKAQDAIQMISLLYRICSEAQSSASAQAIESTIGIIPCEHTQWVRRQLLNMEIVREHSWRILLDWPVILGEQADKKKMNDIMSLSNRWKESLDPEQQAYQLESDQNSTDEKQTQKLSTQIDQLLSSALFSMPASQWLSLSSSELMTWVAEQRTGAARLLNYLLVKGWASLGYSDIDGLPDLDGKQINDLLSGKEAEEFVCRPCLDGQSYESTAFSRNKTHPNMEELLKKFGSGLFTRFVAVLLEVAQVLEAMKSVNQDACIGSTKVYGTSSGIGVVEAARGRLIHRVQIKDDAIESYQIVAPTEWNFHPQGALAEGLKHLQADDQQSLERQAHLLVQVMDPCVAYSLKVNADA